MTAPTHDAQDSGVETPDDLVANDAIAAMLGTETDIATMPRAGAIPDVWVASYARRVDASGMCEQLDAWRAKDREVKGAGGRPPVINQRAILVMLFILAHEHRPLLLTCMAELLQTRFSDEAKRMLDIPIEPTTDDGWYHRVARSFASLRDVVDPYPGPRNRILTKAEHKAVLAARDAATSRCKLERLDWLCNQVIEMSIQVQPRWLRRRWKGNACVDATLVKSWGKRGTSDYNDYVGFEYDAGWYVREGDHRDPGQLKRRKSPGKVFWGWEAVLAVMGTNDPSRKADFPLLVTGIAFDKPGHNVGENGLKVFASTRARQHPAGAASGDLAYFPNSRPEKLQLPMRAMGYSLVFDYKDNQLGVTESYNGAIQVEGWWYSPSMPQVLIDASIDYRVRKTIDKATWHKRIAQRRVYAIRPKERPDADGHTPMMCPAAGPNPTVLCPLKTFAISRRSPASVPSTIVQTPPEHPGKICTNKTSVSFPPSAGAKYRQEFQYGSEEWRAAYATTRNTIEGFNGMVKQGGHEALDDPSRRQVRGYTAQYLLSAFLVASANIRKIAAFIAEHPEDRPVDQPKVRRPRRRDRLGNYGAEVADVGGDPPAA